MKTAPLALAALAVVSAASSTRQSAVVAEGYAAVPART
jgi:hypothetical protein